jgi:uncharacterized protein YndB with AHSA1/START domain
VSRIEQHVEPIVQSVEIEATPERVFRLLTEPEQLVKWLPEAASFEPRVGGRVHLVFAQGEAWGEVTRFAPPHALAFTWIREAVPDVPTTVEITITDLGEGRCRVDLVHSGWDAMPDGARWRTAHAVGWSHFLGCLVDLAAGRPVDKSLPTYLKEE